MVVLYGLLEYNVDPFSPGIKGPAPAPPTPPLPILLAKGGRSRGFE